MTDARRLHRVHAAAKATRLDLLGVTWRADGRMDLAVKTAIAHRLAVCWNVLEGLPTEAIETGVLRRMFDAVEAGDLAAARRELLVMDRLLDTTDGRLSDCKQCEASLRGAGDGAADPVDAQTEAP